MTAREQHASASLNRNAGEAILANIALAVMRKGPSLPAPIQFVRNVDPAACIPPAHVAAAAMKKDRA